MSAVLKKEIRSIIERSAPNGWVLEPDAKRILHLSGIAVPRFQLAKTGEQAVQAARSIGYPVAAKLVSPAVVHKSEVNGVAVGIQSDEEIRFLFNRFSTHEGFAGMLVEPMAAGLELIVGGTIDAQFGPVVMLGLGGTGVEIYKDIALRMAPIKPREVPCMVDHLKAGELLQGFRGAAPIDMQALIALMTAFSGLLMKLADQVTSIDLNPVFCSPEGCVVADARIMLAG
jgi:acetate---CoA ligase (ADP-forming) subunit beta